MINIVTSNIIPIKSIYNYNDNFIICHLHTVTHPFPYSVPKLKYLFDIYHQDEMIMDDSDSYASDEDMEYRYHPVASITEALNQIAEDVIQFESDELEKDEDLQQEITLAVSCDYPWNKQVIKYLNNQFTDHDSDLTCLDIYNYMKIGSIERLGTTLKSMLGTNYIYPEDPIAFGYAIYQAVK